MKIDELKTLSVQELEAKVLELKKELLDLRFQLATGNLENTAKIKVIKKDVARIKTVLSEKN